MPLRLIYNFMSCLCARLQGLPGPRASWLVSGGRGVNLALDVLVLHVCVCAHELFEVLYVINPPQICTCINISYVGMVTVHIPGEQF